MINQNNEKGTIIMVAVNQNYFNFNSDYFIPSLKYNNSFFKSIGAYGSTLKELYNLNKFLQVSIYNIENFLLLNGADSVEKIDNILITLEEFTDFSNELLEDNQKLKKWYNYPLRYMVDRVETSNMSLQAMLGSKQAQIMHQNKTNDH